MSGSGIVLRPVVELGRIEEHEDFGTFGFLRIDKQAFCVTLEPPDRENAVNRSSIPAQQYLCFRYRSPTFGWTFRIAHVPGRTAVLFHPGNTVEDTTACIILGRKWGTLGQNRAVLNSGATFAGFMEVMRGVDAFHLTINEYY